MGPGLEHLGEFFNLFSFLDHVDGEHVGGRGLLYFFVQLTGELVKPLNPFAEFLLVSLQQSSFCGSRSLRIRVNLRRVRSFRGLWRRGRSWRILGEEPSILSREQAACGGQGNDERAPCFTPTGLLIPVLVRGGCLFEWACARLQQLAL